MSQRSQQIILKRFFVIYTYKAIHILHVWRIPVSLAEKDLSVRAAWKTSNYLSSNVFFLSRHITNKITKTSKFFKVLVRVLF